MQKACFDADLVMLMQSKLCYLKPLFFKANNCLKKRYADFCCICETTHTYTSVKCVHDIECFLLFKIASRKYFYGN